MQPNGLRLLAFISLLFTAFADQPLVQKWTYEQPVPAASTPSGGAFISLHLHDKSLTYIYQAGAERVGIDRLTRTGDRILHRDFQFLTNGGFRLRKTAATPAGNIILAGMGEVSSLGVPPQDLHIIQLDSSGNELWRHHFADAQYPPDLAHDLLVDEQNNVYLGASINWEFVIAKFSPTGSLLWQTNSPSKTGNPVSGAYSLALHPNGGLYAVDRDRLLRLTTNGEIVWEKTTPAIQDTIRIGPSGSLFLGMRQPFFNNDPQPLAKFDESGNHLWTSFGADDFAVLPDERYVIPSAGITVVKADGSSVEDVVNLPINSVSQILQRADHRLFLSSSSGIQELRPDLSRAGFYPEPSSRHLPDFAGPLLASDGTNIYSSGVYRDTNNVLWAELRAWGPTNSAALPNILEHPTGATVVAGGNFTTSVRAAATPAGFALSYQWYEWGWGGFYAIEGATNTTLQLTNLQPEFISIARPRTFSVRVTNSLGTIYSRDADVWVHIRPNATNPPVSTPSLAYFGDSVEWRITSTATEPLRIQWYRDSIPIDGANSSSYIITNAGPEHLGHYSFSLSNAVGQSTSSMAPFTNFLSNSTVEELRTLPGSALALPLLQNDGAGKIIAVNTHPLAIGSEIVISKFDSAGRLLWSTNANFLGNSVNRSPSDVRQALAFNSAGDILLAGSTPGDSTPRQPAILRISADGDILGQISLATRVTRITNLKVASSGDIYVGGALQDGSAYYVLVCLTPTGEEKWSRRVPATVPYASMHWNAPTQFDRAGNVLFTAPNARQVYSFTSNGATNWSTSLNAIVPFDLESAPDGTFYLSGLATNRAALVRITDKGAKSFTMYLPHVSTAIATDLQIDPAGALYYLAATSPSVGARPTLSLLHTNATPVWCASFFSETEPAFAFASGDSIFVASSHTRIDEAGLMKFDPNGVRRWTRTVHFGGQPIVALANDSVVFATAFTGEGDIPLFRIEDEESPDVRQASAVITQLILNNSPHLSVSAVNAEVQRVRWSKSTTSVRNDLGYGHLLQIAYPPSPSTGWSAEVTIPGAILVTPDFFPVPIPILLTPQRSQQESFSITVHGRPNTQFILESSLDLRNWFFFTQGYLEQNATATVSINATQIQRFFRVTHM